MTLEREPAPASTLVRVAAVCALVGLSCMSVFLWLNFSPWSVGIGIVAGAPLTAIALALYLLAVVRELRQRGEL